MHGRWNEDPFQVAKTRKHRGERMVAVLREEVGGRLEVVMSWLRNLLTPLCFTGFDDWLHDNPSLVWCGHGSLLLPAACCSGR